MAPPAVQIVSLLSFTLLLVSVLLPIPSLALSPVPPGTDTTVSPVTNPTGAYDPDLSGVSTDYNCSSPNGTWSLVTKGSGVSGIHWAITPMMNTLVLIDRSDKDNSYITDR